MDINNCSMAELKQWCGELMEAVKLLKIWIGIDKNEKLCPRAGVERNDPTVFKASILRTLSKAGCEVKDVTQVNKERLSDTEIEDLLASTK